MFPNRPGRWSSGRAAGSATSPAGGCSRRGVIRGAVGAAVAVTVPAGLAGCGLLGGEPEPEPEPDPLSGLFAATLDLIAHYAAASATVAELGPLLAPVVATHRAHADELSRLTGIALPATTAAGTGGQPAGSSSGAPSGTATPAAGSNATAPPADRAAVLTELRSAEEAAAAGAAEACHTAAADRAALLGSIAAARACHLEVLR